MERKPLISVIIPAYNNDKYIEGAIRSLLVQTYGNIEIIVVNDGSTDNTKEMLDAYKDNEKVIVINKENGGVSSARNCGLNAAKGEYIAFLDADDEYVETAFEEMVKTLNEDTDVLSCSFNKLWLKWHSEEKRNYAITKEEFMANLYEYYLDFNFVCANLYRAEIIKENSILFNETITYAEDYDFNLRFIKCSEKLQSADLCVYNYYLNRSAPHPSNDNPARSIAAVIDFYDGKENMTKDIYDLTFLRIVRRCVFRYLWWYNKSKAAELLEDILPPALAYADNELLYNTFTKEEADALIDNDYKTFVNEFSKREKDMPIKKIKYKVSKFIASRFVK